MKTLRDIGEFGLIERVTRALPTSDAVVEGIGDDCAVVRLGDRLLLVSCDVSIEGVHFNRDWAEPSAIGWRAAVAALSDIAAMGGRPLCALVTLACPNDTEVAFAEALYAGLAEALAQSGAVIAGGDVSRSPAGIVIDLTVLGEAIEGRYLPRKGAIAGDALVVTGYPGRSAAGLRALERGVDAPELLRAHLRPSPRIAEGRWFASRPGAHAMIDLSDGLAQDAGHLADAAGLGLDLYPENLPLATGFEQCCAALGSDPRACILEGGEDYELALAVDSEQCAALVEAFRGTYEIPLTVVGRFTDRWRGVRAGGETIPRTGFDHFGA